MSTMTPRQVADDLQVSVFTAVQHMRAGLIGGAFQIVPGGPWRVDTDAYTAWRAAKAQPADDPERIEQRTARSRAAQSRNRSNPTK